jgi:hypothetical protein
MVNLQKVNLPLKHEINQNALADIFGRLTFLLVLKLVPFHYLGGLKVELLESELAKLFEITRPEIRIFSRTFMAEK